MSKTSINFTIDSWASCFAGSLSEGTPKLTALGEAFINACSVSL